MHYPQTRGNMANGKRRIGMGMQVRGTPRQTGTTCGAHVAMAVDRVLRRVCERGEESLRLDNGILTCGGRTDMFDYTGRDVSLLCETAFAGLTLRINEDHPEAGETPAMQKLLEQAKSVMRDMYPGFEGKPWCVYMMTLAMLTNALSGDLCLP